MEQVKKNVKLGFTNQVFEQGAHICQIFSTDKERQEVLTDYLISGLENNESTACFTNNETADTLKHTFSAKGHSFDVLTQSGSFSLSPTDGVYFTNNTFDPNTSLTLLRDFYTNSQQLQRNGARVIGEMTPNIQTVNGGDRLLEYECKVSMLLKQFPVTAVCQYDARKFNGDVIMDILKVHPYMIVKGTVINNPFFIKPEDYLLSKNIE